MNSINGINPNTINPSINTSPIEAGNVFRPDNFSNIENMNNLKAELDGASILSDIANNLKSEIDTMIFSNMAVFQYLNGDESAMESTFPTPDGKDITLRDYLESKGVDTNSDKAIEKYFTETQDSIKSNLKVLRELKSLSEN